MSERDKILKELLVEEGLIQSEDDKIIAELVDESGKTEDEGDNIFDTINDIFTGTGARAEFPAEIDLANVWGVTEKSGVDSF